jgi:hypothetical protein
MVTREKILFTKNSKMKISKTTSWQPMAIFLDNFQRKMLKSSVFYLPHMEYEGSIGFVMRKMKKKNIADFHVLGLFVGKKHDLNDKIFSVCHAPLPHAKFVLHLQARLKC